MDDNVDFGNQDDDKQANENKGDKQEDWEVRRSKRNRRGTATTKYAD